MPDAKMLDKSVESGTFKTRRNTVAKKAFLNCFTGTSADDEILAILDDALSAAEEKLKLFAKHYTSASITAAFKAHVQIHLGDEMANIGHHGHRNDDPEDAPPAVYIYALYSDDDDVVLYNTERDALEAKMEWDEAGANNVRGPFTLLK